MRSLPITSAFDDLNRVLVFVAVARERGLSRGASVLGLPKSTVSRQLAAFEREAGAKLIEMTPRRFALTDAGKTYFEHLERIVEELQAAHVLLTAQQSSPRGRLRVSAPSDFAAFALADTLASFLSKYPEIELDLVLTPTRVDMVTERFDVAIRMGELADSTLVARRIATLSRGLYAGPQLLPHGRTEVKLSELATLGFIRLAAQQSEATLALTSGRRKSEIPLRGRVIVNSVGMMRQLAVAGAGVAVLPDRMVAEDVRAGRLVRVAAAWSVEPIVASLLVTARKNLPAKTRAFIEHVVQHLADAETART